MKQIKYRLLTALWFGYLCGGIIMFKDVPPSPPSPNTWWDVFWFILFVGVTLSLGYKAGQEVTP